MLFFCHLFAGLLIGIVISWFIHDRRAIIAGIVGAVLPDLIDKPLGHILLLGSLDNGRIIGHTLLIIIFLTGIVAFLINKRDLFYLIALPFGVLSHDLLDMMWNDPAAWTFPLLGPFQRGTFEHYLSNMFIVELTSVSELIFGIASLILLFHFSPYSMNLKKIFPEHAYFLNASKAFCFAVPCMLFFCGITSLTAGIFHLTSPWYPRGLPFENTAIGITALVGVLIFSFIYFEKDLNPFKHS